MKTKKINAIIYEYKGLQYTITELAKLSGVSRETLYGRLHRGTLIDIACQPGAMSKNKALNLARSRADIKHQSTKPKEVLDGDSEDLSIYDSCQKNRTTEEQRKRRNDFYESQVQREIMGEDLW